MSKPWYAFFKRAIVFAALSATPTFAAEPTPGVSLPVVEIVFRMNAAPRVGDVVPYELKESPSDWRVDEKEGALTKGFLFRRGKLFVPLVPGKFQLPSLAIVNSAGEIVAKTDPVEIAAESNLPPPGPEAQPPKPEPPVGPLGLPFPPWVQNTVAFLILALAVLGAFFVVRWLKRRAARALKAILPKKPYDLVALERLDTLTKGDLVEAKALKKVYFHISEVLKTYLGERYVMDAEESTTSELLERLRERIGISGLSETTVTRVETLFHRLDPVKFAEVVPSEEEARAVLKVAKEIVLSTRKPAEILKEGGKR